MFAISFLQQTGPNTNVWIWILVVLLLLVLAWWLLSRRRAETDREQPEMRVSQEAESRSDDLKKIEGIGPKVAKVLNAAGITTFEALARANPSEVQKMLDQEGLQMMNPEGWIQQAELAAKGDWERLETLQGELKGGRKQ
jgi:LPXTG-motif cell wall-anchored protein